jgi:hypothetical protein
MNEVKAVVDSTTEKMKNGGKGLQDFLQDFELAMATPKKMNTLKKVENFIANVEDLWDTFSGQTLTLQRAMSVVNRINKAEEPTDAKPPKRQRTAV